MTVTLSVSTSPFRIASERADRLNSDPSFWALALELANGPQYKYCHSHNTTVDPHAKATFRFHRTIIHAAFAPMLQLLDDASRAAAYSLPGRSAAELELAFRNDARSAFTWLQSSIVEEGDWCRTKGCPACVVLRTFHSEHLIRLLAVACRTCEYLSGCGTVRPGSRLPSVSFLLDALWIAVERDNFWGKSCWAAVDNKSSRMAASIQHLEAQTRRLQRMLQLGVPKGVPSADGAENDGLNPSLSSAAKERHVVNRTGQRKPPTLSVQYGSGNHNDGTSQPRTPRLRTYKLSTVVRANSTRPRA